MSTVLDMTAATKKAPKGKVDAKVTITPPNLQFARFRVRGTAHYVSNRFGQEAVEMMKAKQEAGSTAGKGAKKEAKDFDRRFHDSMHKSIEGWYGIPVSAIRSAIVSACRLVGFKMTLAKLSVFVVEDGHDSVDGDGLIRITKGEPERQDRYVRLASGVADIAPRGHWAPGWEAVVTLRYDADQFTATDLTNLMLRVGIQVGIGAGRPDSTKSCGMGWGTFELVAPE